MTRVSNESLKPKLQKLFSEQNGLVMVVNHKSCPKVSSQVCEEKGERCPARQVAVHKPKRRARVLGQNPDPTWI